jgi:DNA replication and repair protein RecF
MHMVYFCMYLEEISLENFRNYSSKTLTFEQPGSFLCGRNGCGKTNLLEAIYLLSYGKSFRAADPQELVMFSKEHFSIKGDFNGSLKKKIEYRFSKGEKKILINGVEVQSLKELIGNISVILLSLNDISLILGNPVLRRRYLDAALSILHHDYLSDLLDYRRSLRQRNRILYLRKIGRKESIAGIDGWTDKLIQIGSRIIEKRLSIMKEMNECAAFYYSLFSPERDVLSITYKPSVELNGGVAGSFRRALESRVDLEVERGLTETGPHRDELLVDINDLPARKFASEGEQRTCAISLKLAQASFLKNKMKNDPILLVDEAIAELDRARKEKVLQCVTDIGQCFVATTSCEMLSEMTRLKAIDIDGNAYPQGS